MQWRLWFRGLVAAALNAAAGGVTLIIVDPQHFEFDGSALKRLATVCGALALVGMGLYLKQHPVPGWDGTKRRATDPGQV